MYVTKIVLIQIQDSGIVYAGNLKAWLAWQM